MWYAWLVLGLFSGFFLGILVAGLMQAAAAADRFARRTR